MKTFPVLFFFILTLFSCSSNQNEFEKENKQFKDLVKELQIKLYECENGPEKHMQKCS